MPEHAGHLGEQAIVARGDHHRTVRGLEGLVGRERVVTGTHARRDLAGGAVVGHMARDPPQRRLEQRSLHDAALASGLTVEQGGQRADDRPHAGPHVHNRRSDARRRPRRVTVDADQTGKGLQQRFIARLGLHGTGMTESVHAAIDQAWVQTHQRGGIHPQLLLHARAKDHAGAADLFGKFAAGWPGDERAPGALESRFSSLEALKDTKAARATLELLADKYPATDPGKRAKLRLKRK